MGAPETGGGAMVDPGAGTGKGLRGGDDNEKGDDEGEAEAEAEGSVWMKVRARLGVGGEVGGGFP